MLRGNNSHEQIYQDTYIEEQLRSRDYHTAHLVASPASPLGTEGALAHLGHYSDLKKYFNAGDPGGVLDALNKIFSYVVPIFPGNNRAQRIAKLAEIIQGAKNSPSSKSTTLYALFEALFARI